jgi:ParB/RepB/Spo0J family partition protein
MGVSYGTGKFFKKEDPVVVAEMELPSVVLNEAHVIELPIDQIHGVFVGDPPSDTLIKSVGLKGVINLPTVREIHDGTYEVVDGRRRLRALVANDQEYAQVVVNNNVEDSDSASLVSNYLRSDNVLQAAYVVWRRLDSGETEKEIADEEGINVAKIRALRDMRKLRPELIQAVERGTFSPRPAQYAARLDDESQAKLVEILEENGKLTINDVSDVRKVNRNQAKVEVADLFENLPELDDEPQYSGTGDDATDDDPEYVSDEDYAEAVAALDKTKVKISRQDRLANARRLVSESRKELLAIKSNVRNAAEIAALGYLEQALDMLAEEE